MSFILSALSVRPPGPTLGPAPPPAFLPTIGGVAPLIFADFTTEGGTDHYWANNFQNANFAKWLASISGTFTRTGPATIVNSSGVLVPNGAAAGVIRFDYDPAALTLKGILLEGPSTNIAPNSNNFSTGWSVSGGSVAANAAVSPDGTNNAFSFTGSGGNTNHFVNLGNNVGAATVANSNYTASFFVKNNTMNFVSISFTSDSAGAAWVAAVFDLTQGIVSQTANGGSGTLVGSSITNFGNGWFRISVSGSIGASVDGTMFIQGAGAASGNSFGAFGFLTYTDNGNIFDLYGAQLENVSGASSYIPTTSGTATRQNDALSLPLAVTTATILYVTTAIEGVNNGTGRLIGTDVGGDAPLFDFIPTTNNEVGTFTNSGGLIGAFFTGNYTTGRVKSGVTGSPSGRIVTANGAAPASDNNSLFDSQPTTLTLSTDITLTNQYSFGWVAQIGLWNVAATAAQLQALTT